jgi:hypothetical protein
MPALTPAAAEASRRNGALSHGPATAEGKARSALNSLAIGHRAKSFRLRPDEDPQELAALRQGWIDALEPDGVAELTKIEQIVQNQVMLARAEREIGALEAWHAALPEEDRAAAGPLRDQRLDGLTRLQERLERAADRAERAFLRLRRARRQGLIGPPPAPPGPPPASRNRMDEPAPPPAPRLVRLSPWEIDRATRLLPLLERIPTPEGRAQWLRGLPRQDQRVLERHLEARRDQDEPLPEHQEMALNVLSMIY